MENDLEVVQGVLRNDEVEEYRQPRHWSSALKSFRAAQIRKSIQLYSFSPQIVA